MYTSNHILNLLGLVSYVAKMVTGSLRVTKVVIFPQGNLLVNKTNLQALCLSGTNCHKTGTRPPGCATPQELTMYDTTQLQIGHTGKTPFNKMAFT